MWTTKDPRIDEPGDVSHAVLPREALKLWQRAAKRAIDLLVGVPLLLLLLPAVFMAAIAVKLDTPGPAFFVQTRVGKDGREFRLPKLRTMYVGNDDSPHRAYIADLIKGQAAAHNGVYKLVSDSRITRVGRHLRRLSADEIPQLLCVVAGTMSMVGPRPPLPREVELYDSSTYDRLRVKPGLTGPWQVGGRSLLSFQEMVRLDVQYWKGWRLRRDLAILARTPAAVLSRRGAV